MLLLRADDIEFNPGPVLILVLFYLTLHMKPRTLKLTFLLFITMCKVQYIQLTLSYQMSMAFQLLKLGLPNNTTYSDIKIYGC